MYSLSYNSLTEIHNVSTATSMAGSSKFKLVGTELVEKKLYKTFNEIEGNVYSRFLAAIKTCDIWQIPYSPEILNKMGWNGEKKARDIMQYRCVANNLRSKNVVKKNTYNLNKSKVRKKLTALCRLERSKKFIAFYSISFPMSAPDEVLYKIYNKWLTSCRTRYGLKTYAWVAERQENGTLHFHLLTPDWLDIKDVNRSMASSIDTEVKKGSLTWNNSNREKYNGIDVDSPQYPKKRQGENREQYRIRKNKSKKGSVYTRMKWIAYYLVKYVTKNEEEFKHLPYHSSRDVSALFTSQLYNEGDADGIMQSISDNLDDYIIYNNDKSTTYIFKIDMPNILYDNIDKINELVYKKMNPE